MNSEDFCLFGGISKIDYEKRRVYGYATTDAVDSQDEIVDIDATREALKDYSQWRNIREMHSSSAVGTAPILEMQTKGLYIGADVIDDNAWKKVVSGVYKGFSIGGKKLETSPEFRQDLGKTITRIKKYKLNEISLVDRPANPESRFTVAKFDTQLPEQAKAEGLPETSAVAKEVEIKSEAVKLEAETAIAKEASESKPAEAETIVAKSEIATAAPATQETVDYEAKFNELSKAQAETKAKLDELLVKEAAWKKEEDFHSELMKRLDSLQPMNKAMVSQSDSEMAKREEEAMRKGLKEIGLGELIVKGGGLGTLFKDQN